MLIESYSDKYLDDVRQLIKEFHAESLNEYGISFDERALTSTIEELKKQCTGIGYTGGFLAVVDGKAVGLLAGREVKTPWSDARVWHEIVWFMAEKYRKYGIKLLKDARTQLKEQGFAAMVMVHMHNSKTEKLGRLYTRLGFTAMETNYIGRL